MSKERKEGVLIAVFLLFIILVMALWATWPSGILYFEWTKPGAYEPLYYEFEFTTGLMILLPFFIYGLLRAFGIIKRLFDIERFLSCLLPDK
jgi:hypothetical protein